MSPRWPMLNVIAPVPAAERRRVSVFTIAAIALGLGWLAGVSSASIAFGHPSRRGDIEVWRVPVTMPCERWDPPKKAEGPAVRIR